MKSIFDPYYKYLSSKTESQKLLLKLAETCLEMKKDYNHKLPFHINVISAAARGKLKETAHSIILHDLLLHPVILDSFIKNVIGISDNPFTKDNIDTPDKNRIDLCLRNKDFFLIIENKVNSAEEQPGQLYRYCKLAQEEYGFGINKMHILYLNPDHNEPPSLFSRSKNGKGEEDDPETIGVERIKIKNYKHDIYDWLKKCKDDISSQSKDEPFLQSALNQYIDYLEERFQMNHRYKKLHDMTEKQVREILAINDGMAIDDQVLVLEEKLDQLNELQTALKDLKFKIEKESWRSLLVGFRDSLNEKFGKRKIFRMFEEESPEMGFRSTFLNTKVSVSLVLYKSSNNIHTPYWRVVVDASRNSDINDTKEKIKKLLTSVFPNLTTGIAPGWDFYSTTSKETAQIMLEELTGVFLGNPDFQTL